MTAVHSAPASERTGAQRTEAAGVTSLHPAVGSAANTTLVVEKALLAALDVLPEPVRTGCHRVVDAGGKRLRPDLVLRCADIGPLGATAALSAAVAVELLHSASLVHDDLLDDSDTRRGVLAVHRHEGMGTAVIAGDAMIALSWRTIAATGAENVDDLASALAEMCEGQALEERLRFDPSASADDVLRVSELKTGALLKAACRIGARVGGCWRTRYGALGDYGSDFGVALQLMDDVLDLVADQVALGKPIGADFRAGTVTCRRSTPWNRCWGSATRLRSLLRPGVPPEALDEASEIVLGPVRSAARSRCVWSSRSRAARSAAAAGAPAELVSMPERYVRRQIETKVAAAHQGLLPRSEVDWENERVG